MQYVQNKQIYGKNMKINFGLHLGFAINRFSEPKVWTKIVKNELGIKHVQFVSDLLDPSFDINIIDKEVDKINNAVEKHGIIVDHTFTSPRYNFLGHPDSSIALFWFNWLKKFIDISSLLNAKGAGSLLGIYTVNDFNNRKNIIEKRVINYWKKLSVYAKNSGLEYLLWEPMSIKREMGETIKKTLSLNKKLNNKKTGIPINICLDVDHGDLSSTNPEDKNPYKWIEKVGDFSPVIHIKQRTKNVFGHKPFTKKFNKEGLIKPKKIISQLKKLSVEEVYLYLELSFREREPYDSNVISDLQESINFWKNDLVI